MPNNNLLSIEDDLLNLILGFVGKGRFLQIAVCKAITRIYKQKYRMSTSRRLWEIGLPNVKISSHKGQHLRLLHWLKASGCNLSDLSIISYASLKGLADVLDWAYRLHLPMDSKACSNAAILGDVIKLQWLINRGAPFVDEEVCAGYCLGGHLSLLKQARSLGCRVDSASIRAASSGGHIDIIGYLLDNRCPMAEEACTAAARGGKLEALMFLRDRGAPWNESTCTAASSGGHLEILQYCITNGCPINNEDICCAAARSGHLNILIWGVNNGLCFTASTSAMAAAGDHIHILKWLYSRNFPMDESTLVNAAERGHFHIIKWARSVGLSWSWKTFSSACEYGDVEILEWLCDNNCPKGRVDVCAKISKGGSLSALKWARSRNIQWTVRCCTEAARAGHVELLKYARVGGCQWSSWTCTEAARGGHLDCLSWAVEHKCEFNRLDCIRAAREGQHQHVITWIENYGERRLHNANIVSVRGRLPRRSASLSQNKGTNFGGGGMKLNLLRS